MLSPVYFLTVHPDQFPIKEDLPLLKPQALDSGKRSGESFSCPYQESVTHSSPPSSPRVFESKAAKCFFLGKFLLFLFWGNATWVSDPGLEIVPNRFSSLALNALRLFYGRKVFLVDRPFPVSRGQRIQVNPLAIYRELFL